MGEDANNTSKCTSFLAAVVVIAFEIRTILDLSYNCVMRITGAKVGQGRPKSRLRRLPHVHHPAKYERSRRSHRHTGTGKLKVGLGVMTLLCEGHGHIYDISPYDHSELYDYAR